MHSLLTTLFHNHIRYQSPRSTGVPFTGSMEFYEDQTELPGDTVYLAEARQWKTLAACRIDAPCCCIISTDPETDPAALIAVTPSSADVMRTVFIDLPLGVIYNRLMRAAREAASPCSRPSGDALRRRMADLWGQIHSGQLLTHDEISRALGDLTACRTNYYRILCIHSVPGRGDIPAGILPELEALISGSYFFFPTDSNGTRLMGIQFLDRQPFCDFDSGEEVSALLTREGLRMMISNSTKDFSRMNLLYLLTRRTNRLADVLAADPAQPLRFFEEFTMYTVLEFFFQRFSDFFGTDDIIYLAHPAIVHLTRYDQSHGTNLREVLYQYLLNNRDLKHTADALYMHRNTVLNKLNQIRSICPIDFEDGGLTQRLLFSCQLIRYYESELREQLRP